MRKTEFLFLIVFWLGLVSSALAQNDLPVTKAADPDQTAKPDSVMVSGLDASLLEGKLKGRVLIEELNCAACHVAEASILGESKKAPRLSNIAQRSNPYFLEQFIQSPHGTKSGTTMPNMLSHLKPAEQKQVAKSITHFLLSVGKDVPFKLEVPDTVAVEKGEVLFHSVGCVACHSPRNKAGEELLRKTSTPLGSLEKKYNFSSLVEFLVAPHRVRPSGRMPDLRLPRRDVERIAHYLLRETRVPGHLKYTLLRGRVWEGLEENVDKERAGHVDDFSLAALKLPNSSAVLYDGFLKNDVEGEATFFLEMNGGELWINDQQVVKLEASNRRGVKKAQGKARLLAGWNKIKLVYFHCGKEPKLTFEMKGPVTPRQAIPSIQLSTSSTPIQPFVPYVVDPELAKAGGREFVRMGCVKCHDDLGNRVPADIDSPFAKPTPLAKLDRTQGCLGEQKGPWPHFELSASQKKLIQSALPGIEGKRLAPAEMVNKSLVTFNCLACHDRDQLGGVSPDRNHLFTGNKTELGNDGRIPPPLTLVGAKLRKEWIAEVMLRGQRQRPYMATTMPQFGEANVGHLIELFEKVDEIEKVNFEKIEDVARVKAAGHLLMGTKGFSCIACHDFNGQKAAGPGAMEMIHTTPRLKKDWFYWFMLKPSRFRKSTIMPASWPGGHVFMEDVLDGDAKKQIESLWVYLEDGSRAKNPIGLSRKSPELRVADETVICRGRGNAGYRGMAVGYPERISLAFDTQEMNLRLLWKGEFATVGPGRFSARGGDRISFPQGIPFHRLKSLDDNWPYKRKTDYLFPQDQGYRFLGYSLDKQKRPTLTYRYGDIYVKDYFEDRLDDQKSPYFRRTLTFEAPAEQESFYFRAASGKTITKKTESSFRIDRLSLSFLGADRGVVRKGDPQELLIPLKLPQGKTTLTLDYKW